MSLQELLNVNTFKDTMKSLVDFRGAKLPELHEKNEIPKYMVRDTSMLVYSDLIEAESALGRTLFGPIPDGHRREFFAYKKNVWIWHDSWQDNTGETHGVTIRYEVRPNGVYKKYEGSTYKKLEGNELNNFREAARMYLNLIKTNLYS